MDDLTVFNWYRVSFSLKEQTVQFLFSLNLYFPQKRASLLSICHLLTKPSKHLLVLKTSSKRLQCNNFLSFKTSWRRLEDILKTSWKTFWRRLGRRKIVTMKTSWKRLEDMSWRCLEDMPWRHPEDMSWRYIQDVLETKKGNICISQI